MQSYPFYHLVKGMTEKHSGALEDALASLQTAKDFIATKKLPSTFESHSTYRNSGNFRCIGIIRSCMPRTVKIENVKNC